MGMSQEHDLVGCQNYGAFLGPYYNTAPNYLGYPKRDHNFDNHPFTIAHNYVLTALNKHWVAITAVAINVDVISYEYHLRCYCYC